MTDTFLQQVTALRDQLDYWAGYLPDGRREPRYVGLLTDLGTTTFPGVELDDPNYHRLPIEFVRRPSAVGGYEYVNSQPLYFYPVVNPCTIAGFAIYKDADHTMPEAPAYLTASSIPHPVYLDRPGLRVALDTVNGVRMGLD